MRRVDDQHRRCRRIHVDPTTIHVRLNLRRDIPATRAIGPRCRRRDCAARRPGRPTCV